MKRTKQTLELKFERTLPTTPGEAFDAWLDPKAPGTPWNMADKLILKPEDEGFFYWATKDCHHYGRFTAFERPARMQHTWVSPHTWGEESVVTLTFKKQGENTLMTLVHSGLPDDEHGRAHDKGWNYFMDLFAKKAGKKRAAAKQK